MISDQLLKTERLIDTGVKEEGWSQSPRQELVGATGEAARQARACPGGSWGCSPHLGQPPRVPAPERARGCCGCLPCRLQLQPTQPETRAPFSSSSRGPAPAGHVQALTGKGGLLASCEASHIWVILGTQAREQVCSGALAFRTTSNCMGPYLPG